MRKYLYVVAIIAVVVGCATQVKKEWGVIGGSKADGTVKLAYDYVADQIPIVDNEGANSMATKRCQAWGYKKSEPFDSVTKSCILVHGLTNTCSMMRAETIYQCVD